eukprot:CAMPEP_0170543442 /NCGR_PEP_ID=MMETSP0211-20121228/2554_1 /TAXON_ID=311385 /ORGANISM="Pseudokeronopsis sp., Strain OXSARD2" /LENGTH=234 /DNA_ID=CAMNT_0010846815 /DNA_START=501 /DNA_END=1205 /DNA_ORIENTATION=-
MGIDDQFFSGDSFIESDDDISKEISYLVYGRDHCLKQHGDHFYKARLLKNIEYGKILGYPHGLPGGWCRHRKVHFVGHSMGAPTVRYLQHLLEINYFEYGCHCEHEETPFHSQTQVDRSDWIASITCLNPGLNGSVGTYFFGIDEFTHKFEKDMLKGRIFPEGFKHYSMMQNMMTTNGSMNRQCEQIKKNYMKGESKITELSRQYSNVWFEFNVETYGFNRRPGEAWKDYITRV